MELTGNFKIVLVAGDRRMDGFARLTDIFEPSKAFAETSICTITLKPGVRRTPEQLCSLLKD